MPLSVQIDTRQLQCQARPGIIECKWVGERLRDSDPSLDISTDWWHARSQASIVLKCNHCQTQAGVIKISGWKSDLTHQWALGYCGSDRDCCLFTFSSCLTRPRAGGELGPSWGGSEWFPAVCDTRLVLTPHLLPASFQSRNINIDKGVASNPHSESPRVTQSHCYDAPYFDSIFSRSPKWCHKLASASQWFPCVCKKSILLFSGWALLWWRGAGRLLTAEKSCWAAGPGRAAPGTPGSVIMNTAPVWTQSFVTHIQCDTLCVHILASNDHVSPRLSRPHPWSNVQKSHTFCCGLEVTGWRSQLTLPLPSHTARLLNNSFHVSNFQITSVTFQISREKNILFTKMEMESIDRWEERTLLSLVVFNWRWWENYPTLSSSTSVTELSINDSQKFKFLKQFLWMKLKLIIFTIEALLKAV